MKLQLEQLFSDFDRLQLEFGASELTAIYGAGCIKKPKTMLVFMNPTGRNCSCVESWDGIRAPWIGTKNIWKMLFQIGFIDQAHFDQTQKMRPSDWTPDFGRKIYEYLAENSVYITNFAKCTQVDARPLNNHVFRSYKDLLLTEISIVKPEKIITFGNQVSENLVAKKISVRDYLTTEFEEIIVDGRKYHVFPCFYPVGQGQRNMPLAVKRISEISKLNQN